MTIEIVTLDLEPQPSAFRIFERKILSVIVGSTEMTILASSLSKFSGKSSLVGSDVRYSLSTVL
jgi:hypothetical protein